VPVPDEFSTSLRTAMSLLQDVASSLTRAQDPIEAASDQLGAALLGSSRPEAEAAVGGLLAARDRVTEALSAVAHSTEDLAEYARTVLGDAAPPASAPSPAPAAPGAHTTKALGSPVPGTHEVPDLPRKPAAVRPRVSDPKLSNLVDNLYKGVDAPRRVGDGTAMDAIANERRTGRPTSGRYHASKGRETLRGLENWLRRCPDASDDDRRVAGQLIDDLSNALGGR